MINDEGVVHDIAGISVLPGGGVRGGGVLLGGDSIDDIACPWKLTAGRLLRLHHVGEVVDGIGNVRCIEIQRLKLLLVVMLLLRA